MSALGSIVSRVRVALSGDDFHGLGPGEVEEAAKAKPTPEILKAFRHEQNLIRSIRERDEQAHVAHRAAWIARAQKHADTGKPVSDLTDDVNAAGPLKSHAEWVSSLGPSYGLRPISWKDDASASIVIDAAHKRARALATVLQARYRVEGEPRELLDLRVALAKAKSDCWGPRKARVDARERMRHMPGDDEAARLVQEAVALENQAVAAVENIKRQINSQFGIEVL
jgi:hypothetical protein